ncbi:hypothetical protein ACF08B_36120 [Streptomyces sp. NPDC015139]|uniref:hypothetical protein n=1 Tax=Streptomyces sp. NPDC015139 TaxID=3364942 RepID=UPI0036FD16E0
MEYKPVYAASREVTTVMIFVRDERRPHQDRGHRAVVRHLLTDGWWANGQPLFLNGGYTTR